MKNKNLLFYISFFGIFALALLIRIYNLSLRPFHHDEAILWHYFVKKIINKQPLEFFFEQHGLLTYYLAALPLYFLKTSIFSLRLSAALFGASTILPIIFLKKEMGKGGVLISSLAVAISPILVFYSRFLISYPFFNFFFVLLFVFLIKYLKSYKNIYFFFFFLSLICLGLINEAILIIFMATFITLLVFLLSKQVRKRIYSGIKKVKPITWTMSIIVGLIIFLVIQTDFFKNWINIFKLENVFSEMMKKSSHTGHNKPFFYYQKVVLKSDIYLIAPLIILYVFSFIGRGKEFFEKNLRLISSMILVFSLSNFILFSLIHYKTPWVLTVVVLPFFIFAGFSFNLFYKNFSKYKSIVMSAILFILIFFGISLSWSINYNFKTYAQEAKNPLDYVGTTLDINMLVKDIYSLKNSSSSKVLIIANSYWPLPFYLDKEFSLFYLSNKNDISKEMAQNYNFIISKPNQKVEIVPKFKKSYYLRSGYKIVLWQVK